MPYRWARNRRVPELLGGEAAHCIGDLVEEARFHADSWAIPGMVSAELSR